MTESEKIADEVAAMAREAESALAAETWCAVVPEQRPLVWSEVLGRTGRVVRQVRGRKMRTWQGLMDEFGAALQLGSYFGENLGALDECLSDLDWLPTEVGYVLVVLDPEQVLADEADHLGRPNAELANLVTVLGTAAATFAEPIELGEAWDRPAIGFDVLLVPAVDEASRVRHVWQQAGAPLGA